jgi:hypothetical protein
MGYKRIQTGSMWPAGGQFDMHDLHIKKSYLVALDGILLISLLQG